jgi:predicted HD phosphohydrolase
MNYLLIGILLSLSTITANAGLDVFRDYLDKAQRQHAVTESRLINAGESYLDDHVRASEKLSLAEFLPMTPKEYKEFCRDYPKDVLGYYNLKQAKTLQSIKSAAFIEFDKMVKAECQKAKK